MSPLVNLRSSDSPWTLKQVIQIQKFLTGDSKSSNLIDAQAFRWSRIYQEDKDTTALNETRIFSIDEFAKTPLVDFHILYNGAGRLKIII